jgi:hypothetical protein
MMSEWMKVMLEEIARKKADAESAQVEERERRENKDKTPRSEPKAARD